MEIFLQLGTVAFIKAPTQHFSTIDKNFFRFLLCFIITEIKTDWMDLYNRQLSRFLSSLPPLHRLLPREHWSSLIKLSKNSIFLHSSALCFLLFISSLHQVIGTKLTWSWYLISFMLKTLFSLTTAVSATFMCALRPLFLLCNLISRLQALFIVSQMLLIFI